MSEVTVEHLERALALCAYFVVQDGPVVVPLFERLERELAAMRSNENTIVRAKALLANLATAGVPMQHKPPLTSGRDGALGT